VAAGRVDESVFPEDSAVPDACGERKDALADTRPDTGRDVTGVVLEGELSFEGR
jgi:hypothetical protein